MPFHMKMGLEGYGDRELLAIEKGYQEERK
jgi:hypothetical protein